MSESDFSDSFYKRTLPTEDRSPTPSELSFDASLEQPEVANPCNLSDFIPTSKGLKDIAEIEDPNEGSDVECSGSREASRPLLPKKGTRCEWVFDPHSNPKQVGGGKLDGEFQSPSISFHSTAKSHSNMQTEILSSLRGADQRTQPVPCGSRTRFEGGNRLQTLRLPRLVFQNANEQGGIRTRPRVQTAGSQPRSTCLIEKGKSTAASIGSHPVSNEESLEWYPPSPPSSSCQYRLSARRGRSSTFSYPPSGEQLSALSRSSRSFSEPTMPRIQEESPERPLMGERRKYT